MDKISAKTLDIFRGKVVRKDLTQLMKRGVNVPSFVLEYLLGSYCATDDQAAINKGIEKISKILASNYVRSEDVEKIKFTIMEKGEYAIIDKMSAIVDERRGVFLATFSNFDIGYFILDPKYAKQFPTVFSGGLWCMVKLAYKREKLEQSEEIVEKKEDQLKLRKVNPRASKQTINDAFEIVSIKPIQIPNVSIDFILDARSQFTTEEWMHLMLRSTGIEPNQLNEKERMHFLERVVPMFERNYNLVELGPRGTGKSHIYKEISPYSILLSGGYATISNLFYNLNTKRVGMVANWDCIAFDEVSGMGFNNPLGLQILKDYMASGSFSRGRDPVYSDASMVFIGNTNDTVSNMLKTSHLFIPFPAEFSSDAAFFDRMHYYLPGWEVPKIKADYLTTEFAFISDYFAEYAKEMRKKDFSYLLNESFTFNKNVNTRDEIAIRKTVNGLLKILYPDEKVSKEEIEKILVYAIEGRRRVKEQLRRIAGDEFADVDLGYITKDGKEVIVNVPEKLNETLISSEPMKPGHIFTVGYSTSFQMPAVYKLEVRTIKGEGKYEIQGLRGWSRREALESVNASWKYFVENGQKVRKFSGLYDRDYLIYLNDIQRRNASSEISVALFIAFCSAALNVPVKPSLCVVGDVTLSSTLTHIKGTEDYVRFAKNAGANKILLPKECRLEFDKISDKEIKGKIEPIYYSSPLEAAKYALSIDEEENIYA